MPNLKLRSFGWRILIVEDVEGVLAILGEIFTKEGFYVNLAHNGQEGLELALLRETDIILADVLMPKLDGMEMVKRLRLNEKTKNIPVFFLSILSESEYNHRLSELTGIAGILWKNELSLDEIVRRVKAYCIKAGVNQK